MNFLTIATWLGFFFLSLLGKNHQILHIYQCNVHQKRKLWILPKFMYRFSCSFELKLLGCLLCFPWAKENSPSRNQETPSRSQVGSKAGQASLSVVAVATTFGFYKESSICSCWFSLLTLYRICDKYLLTAKLFMQMRIHIKYFIALLQDIIFCH